MFNPYAAIIKTANTSSTRWALPIDSASPNLYTDMFVTNSGTVSVYIKLGDSSVVADATTSIIILPGTMVPLGRKQCTHVAAITPSSTAIINIVLGNDS